tara:strand:+ start:785 stop:2893 length:2109 start_codon:yes stop_codon:yes gene_type:complete
VAQANVKLTVDARGATKALQGVQNKTNQLQKSFGGLRTAIAGIGIGLLARNTVKTTANFQALQIRMRVLTSEFGEFAQVQNLVTKAQDKFNLSIVEATQGITDIFARLRPLGVELADIEKTFFGFNSIAKIAGLNATEASAAFTQLAQGLGSGRLQGDEFRSIAEQVPQLLKAISDETGIASGKLKDFASKGLLKSDIIIRALSKSAEGLGKQIKDIIDESPAEKFKKLNNELLELQLTVGSKLTPALADGAVALASLVEAFTNFIDSEEGQVALIITGAVLAIKALSVAAAFVIPQMIALKVNIIGLAAGFKIFTGILVGTKATLAATSAGFATAAIAANTFKVALAKTGIGLVVIALGLLAASLMKTKNIQQEFNDLLEKGSVADITARINDTKAAIESVRVLLKTLETDGRSAEAKGLAKDIEAANNKLELLEEALEKAEARELSIEFEKIKKNLQESNKNLSKSNEIAKELTAEAKIQKEFDLEKIELQKKFKGEQLEELLVHLENNKKLKEGKLLIEQKQEAAKKLKETMLEVGQVIEDSIKNNLKDAITGAKTFGEAMVGVLNRIRDKMLDSALDKLFDGFAENFSKGSDGGKGLGGFLGKVLGGLFADGGRPPVGKASIVGERGPELFVPSTSGTIIPNNQIGGESITNNIVVNVDVSNTEVAGNNSDATQFGEQLAAAIQAEIVTQKRSGGLLS